MAKKVHWINNRTGETGISDHDTFMAAIRTPGMRGVFGILEIKDASTFTPKEAVATVKKKDGTKVPED